MAIIRVGAAVGAISGSVGSLTFVNARSGPQLRTKRRRTPQNGRTQLQQQAWFETVHRSWFNSSNAIQTAWNNAARNYPRTNRLGISYTLTGLQLYASYRNHFFLPGLVAGLPPANLAATPTPYNVTFTPSLAGTFSVDWDDFVPNAGHQSAIYATRPVTSRPLTHFTSWTGVGGSRPLIVPYDIKTQFIFWLGTPAIGETIAIQILLCEDNSWPSQRVQAIGTVVA